MDSPAIDDFLRRVVEISKTMLELADRGDEARRDAGCGVVFGTLRDNAYKIRRLAEKELEKHGSSVRNDP